MQLAHKAGVAHAGHANHRRQPPRAPRAASPCAFSRQPSPLSSVDQASRLETQLNLARAAHQQRKLGLGFSAGGLLFPYYLGLAEQLQELGILNDSTHLAGASAGSLIAACVTSGLALSTIQDACFELARDCRSKGTRHRLGPVLASTLRELLPADVAERCSGRVHVAVTRLDGGVRPQLVSRFRDRDDLIAALLTSCHIPWYFDGKLTTSFRNRAAFDGGITNFLPSVPGRHTVKVCCLPAKQLSRVGGIDIAPDVFDDWPHDLRTMLAWAFEPAEEEQLLGLIQQGRADAARWAHAAGLLGGIAGEDSASSSSSSGSGSRSYNSSSSSSSTGSDKSSSTATAETRQRSVLSLLGERLRGTSG